MRSLERLDLALQPTIVPAVLLLRKVNVSTLDAAAHDIHRHSKTRGKSPT